MTTTRKGPEFEVISVEEADVRVVAVRGELDLLTAPELAGHLYEAAETGVAALLVDLAEVDFMDSTGISALLTARKALNANGAPLAVCCLPDGEPRRVLQLTGLTTLIPTFDDRASAVEALSANRHAGG